jgi:hypothetical protein
MITSTQLITTNRSARLFVTFADGMSSRNKRAEVLRLAALAEQECGDLPFDVWIDRDEYVITVEPKITHISSQTLAQARSVLDGVANGIAGQVTP